MAVIRYLAGNGRVTRGSIRVDGEDIVRLSDEALRRLRIEKVSMVYQDPSRALNPSMRVLSWS